MNIVEIKTVEDLKNLIKDLPNEFPVGTYHKRYWTPKLTQGKNMCVTEKGLAVDIDYNSDY